MNINGELRLAVIGAGLRSHLAINAHKPQEGVRLVAVADPREEALRNFRKKIGDEILYLKDYRELLDRNDIDAVFILSPDYLHTQHSIDCLNSGKDLYIEKPLAINIQDCDKILHTAMVLGRKIYVGHNMRHMEFLLKIKQVIDDGMIGEVKAAWCRHFVGYGGDAYFKDWHAERSKCMGLLLQKATHDIDVLHWLCGGITSRVVAMGQLSVYNMVNDFHGADEFGDAKTSIDNWPPLAQKQLNPNLDVEDLSHLLLELDNGVLASYNQCHYTPDSWRNYTIIGTEGRVENIGDFSTDTQIKVWNKRKDSYHDSDYSFTVHNNGVGHGGADEKIVDDFINYLKTDECENCFAVEARNSVAAGYMGTISLRKGSIPMDVPILDKEIASYYNLKEAILS